MIASVFLYLLKTYFGQEFLCFNMGLLEYRSCSLPFLPALGTLFPIQQQRRTHVHLQKTTTRNMSSPPSQFRLSSMWRCEERQVESQILGLFMLVVSSQVEETKRWLLYPGSYQTQGAWASLSIFLHMISACVFCADPTPALSSLVVTRISEPSSHFLFIMPVSPSIMLSEPCSCWLRHVFIILLMHSLYFVPTNKICPTCIIICSNLFLIESASQFFSQTSIYWTPTMCHALSDQSSGYLSGFLSFLAIVILNCSVFLTHISFCFTSLWLGSCCLCLEQAFPTCLANSCSSF